MKVNQGTAEIEVASVSYEYKDPNALQYPQHMIKLIVKR